MYLVKANADLREHAGLQHLVVVALYGGLEADQAFLHGTGNFLEVVEVPWSQTTRICYSVYSQKSQSCKITLGKCLFMYMRSIHSKIYESRYIQRGEYGALRLGFG